MSRKGKPATLTSSLLARKGEAEPSRLADGSIPKDVMSLQEELIARVTGGIGAAEDGPKSIDIAPRMPGQVAPKLPIDRVYVGFSAALDREDEIAAPANEPQAEDVPDAFAQDETAVEAEAEIEPVAVETAAVLVELDEEENEEDEALPLPVGAMAAEETRAAEQSAGMDALLGPEVPEEEDMDIAAEEEAASAEAMAEPNVAESEAPMEAAAEAPPPPAPAAEPEEEEPAATLADWTERIRKLEHRPLVAESDDSEEAEEEKRSSFVPLALTIAAVTVVAGFVFWQFASQGEVFAPAGAPETASRESALPSKPAAPIAEAPLAPAGPGSSVAASKPPTDSLPTLGPTERTGAAESAAKPAARPASPPATAPAQAASPAPASQGGYAIQLISTVSQQLAEQAWTQLEPRVSALAASHAHEIVKADLGAKGVRYRVMLTGFASLDAARAACKTVEGKGAGCLVLRH